MIFVLKAWSEQHRIGAPKKIPECINQLKKKNRRKKLPKTVTIDSIYEKNFLSLSSVLEAVIVEEFILPGTSISHFKLMIVILAMFLLLFQINYT